MAFRPRTVLLTIEDSDESEPDEVSRAALTRNFNFSGCDRLHNIVKPKIDCCYLRLINECKTYWFVELHEHYYFLLSDIYLTIKENDNNIK